MNTLKKTVFSCFSIAAVLLVMAASATNLHAAVIGSLRGVVGNVDILHGGALPSIAAKNGDKISTGDLIRTKADAYAEVVYNEGTILRISPRSRVDIGEHFSGNNPNGSEVRLAKGKVQAIVDLKNVKSSGTGAKKFEVRTPNAIAGVRGTDILVSHQGSSTSVYLRSGSAYSLNLRQPGRIVNLTPGTITHVSGRNPPTAPRRAQAKEIKSFEQDVKPPAGSGQQGSASTTGGSQSGSSAPSTNQNAGGSAPATTGSTPASTPQTTTSGSMTSPVVPSGAAQQAAAEAARQAAKQAAQQAAQQAVQQAAQQAAAEAARQPTKVNVNVGIRF